jgi:UDP-N-acetylmuramoyl-tripeptide--D-alanyl-D-alanine ligase
MKNRVLLTPSEIAEVTNGYWVGNTDNLKIKSITNGIINNNIVDSLWIVRNPDNWGEKVPNTLNNIPRMIEQGASSIVVEVKDKNYIESYKVIPFLLVNNTRKALYSIAEASSRKAQAIKKVQITGTEGKTSFKYFLSALTNKQINTYFQKTSANMQVPILLSLANIKSSTELTVIEISCPAKGLGKSRSELVNPSIAIITNVNPSHLNSHGGLDELISDKAESVIGLKPNGFCLVNRDSDNFDTLVSKIRQFRRDINIKTYGSHSNADSYVVNSEFKDLGWNITASINGKYVTYRVNKVHEHIPGASVGVLLTVDLLGLDIEMAARDFSMLEEWFVSSGEINRIKMDEKNSFIFYDQHFSITEIALKSSLNDVNRINVKGKKIAVISGEYNCDKYTEEVHLRIGNYINESDIDYLYTVGEYINISTSVLNNKSIHKGHFEDIRQCTEKVLSIVEPNDLLLVKGMTKLNFKYLANSIYKRYGIK